MKKTIATIYSLLFVCILHAQIITTVVGTGTIGFYGDGLSAKSAQLDRPNTIAFDKLGNMYLCDVNNNRIRKVNTAGIITTVAGDGTKSYKGDNGPATIAGLDDATSIAVDQFGNLYIGTTEDHRIRKVNTAGIITTIAGTGVSGYNGDNIQATSAQLFYPYVAGIDVSGNVYFSDYDNHRVRKINSSGIITTIAGNGTSGYGGDGGPATNAQLSGPTWLCLTLTGDIYIPDNIANRVRKVDVAGVITLFAGGGTGGDGGPAIAAKLKGTNGVTFDNNTGNAYIAESGAFVIRKVNTAGIISTVAGTGIYGYSGDGGPATLAMIIPNTIACDASGNVYIADVDNHRIRRITYNSTAVTEINTTPQTISIYPNPAKNEVNIEDSQFGKLTMTNNESEEILLYDAIGQLMYRQQMNKDKTTINISAYPPGLYFVQVAGIYAGRFAKE